MIGAVLAVAFAYVLRGPGGGAAGTRAAQGTLGVMWRPGRIGLAEPAPDRPADQGDADAP
jgi:aquaporin Z